MVSLVRANIFIVTWTLSDRAITVEPDCVVRGGCGYRATGRAPVWQTLCISVTQHKLTSVFFEYVSQLHTVHSD